LPTLPASVVGAARDGQDVADSCIQPLLEDASQTDTLLFVLQLRVEWIDVRGQPALLPHVIEGVLVGREQELRCAPEAARDPGQKAVRQRRRIPVVRALTGEQGPICPDGLAIPTPEAVQRPAGQGLARVPLSLAEVSQPGRRVVLLEMAEKAGGP